MVDKKIIFILLIVFIVFPFKQKLAFSACGTVTNACPNCSGGRYRTNPSESCNIGTHCCGSDCSSSCCNTTCTPPPCTFTGGTNADGDPYDAQCGDCNDNDPHIYLGHSEFLHCDVASCKQWDPSWPGVCIEFEYDPANGKLCGCVDGKNNDCAGGTDSTDAACPANLNKDWVIFKSFTLNQNKIVTGGVWVAPGVTLTIAGGRMLRIQGSGLHIAPGGNVRPMAGARIRFN